MTRSVLALVDGKPWDMHRPFENSCELELVHFRMDDPSICNEVENFTCFLLLVIITATNSLSINDNKPQKCNELIRLHYFKYY